MKGQPGKLKRSSQQPTASRSKVVKPGGLQRQQRQRSRSRTTSTCSPRLRGRRCQGSAGELDSTTGDLDSTPGDLFPLDSTSDLDCTDNLLPDLLAGFPQMHLSSEMLRHLWNKGGNNTRNKHGRSDQVTPTATTSTNKKDRQVCVAMCHVRCNVLQCAVMCIMMNGVVYSVQCIVYSVKCIVYSV